MNVIDLVDGNEYEPGADGYIIKAGQGGLEYNWRDLTARARADGKPTGLYWVIDARISPEAHKAEIKRAFPAGDFGELGFWLDIEKPTLRMTDAEYRALPYAYYKPVESVWRGVQAYCGIYPGFYFSPGTWDLIMPATPEILQQEFAAKSPLWIAHHYAQAPMLRGKWLNWVMWQWRGEPDYNHVDPVWWSMVNQNSGGIEVAEYKYSITPLSTDGSKVRSGPGTQYTQIASLKFGDTALGNDINSSPGEQWLHVLAPMAGWIASLHNGIPYATVTALEPTEPPIEPPPDTAVTLKSWQVVVEIDGKEYTFAGQP